MRYRRSFHLAVAAVTTIGVVLLIAMLGGWTGTYLGRMAVLRGPDVEDYRKLPTRTVPAGPASVFPAAIEQDWITRRPITYQSQVISTPQALDDFLAANDTTAFLVLKDGVLVDERYFNGYGRDSLCKSFSISKSVLSALFGIAQDEGLVAADDRVGEYLTDLDNPRLADVRLQHLLDNTSGFAYERGFAPWKQQPQMYYTTDARAYLRSTEVVDAPGERFTAEDLSPLLLATVLETALRRQQAGATLSEYASRKLWIPMGAEHHALWVLDRDQDGLEKTESGLVARAMDLARFGQLYLNQGRANGRQIVPQSWAVSSVSAPAKGTPTRFVEGFYRNLWWGYFRPGRRTDDFYANGHFGQRIYVSPDSSLVIVRMGSDSGSIDWTEALALIADAWHVDLASAEPEAAARAVTIPGIDGRSVNL